MRYRTVAVDKNSEENSTAVIDYVWLGERLVSMVVTDGDSTSLAAKYLYNSSDEIIGFNWVNGVDPQTTYYYLKNIQGDITGIVNSSGKLEISFNYDVWGKVTTDYHVDSSSPLAALQLLNKIYISILNPFGYRGYCLDGYTNLYYLQSRYYDPNTGRFINADNTNYLDATGTVLGCNLFAYCENDPVNNVDPRGTGHLVVGRGVVALVIDVALMAIPGIGAMFAPIKAAAKQLGLTLVKKQFSSRILSVVGKFIKNLVWVCNNMVKSLQNYKLLKNIKFIKNLTGSKLAGSILGVAFFKTPTYKILNLVIKDIDILLSIGGLVSGMLDYLYDKKVNNVVWEFKW